MAARKIRSVTRWRKPLEEHPLYRSWNTMKQRCFNPRDKDWENYGGRGISMCERWRGSFLAFLDDMGPRPEGHVIDRADNDKGYFPGNCQWVTTSESARNRRVSVFVEHGGRRIHLLDAAREHGIKPITLRQRLKRPGATVEKALSTPVNNAFVEFRGRRVRISHLAEEIGMRMITLYTRIKVYGWDVERAVTQPIRKHGPSPPEKRQR